LTDYVKYYLNQLMWVLFFLVEAWCMLFIVILYIYYTNSLHYLPTTVSKLADHLWSR
jgi:hypothetical protein